MQYNRTIWQDRIVEQPFTYSVTNNADGTITLTPFPKRVIQVGTPVNATKLNNIEQGITDMEIMFWMGGN